MYRFIDQACKRVRFLGFDIKSNRFIDIENDVFDRYAFNLHNATLLLFLLFCLLFYADIYLNAGGISASLMTLFWADSTYLDLLREDTFRLLYIALSWISLFFAVTGSIYFYFRYGGCVEKRALIKRHVVNFPISIVLTVLVRALLLLLVYYGMYLALVYYPEAIGLDQVSGFLILQCVILSKAYALLITPGVSGLIILLMPFSLRRRLQ